MNKNTAIGLILLIVIVVIGFFAIYNRNQKSQLDETSNVKNMTTFTRNGVQIEILKEGSGVEAKNGNTVTVNYSGTLKNGFKFDSSYDRGTSFNFTLGAGRVIPGWEIGVLGMKIGEKRKLTIPSGLAYGKNGAGGVIPPDATLIFEIELLGVK